MKKYALLSLLLIGGITASAQLGSGLNKWKISSVGHQHGILIDEYKTMSIDWMRGHTKNEEVIALEEDVEYTVYNDPCVMGQQYGFNIALSSVNLKNEEVSTSQEIRISANVVTGREAMVQYSSQPNEDPDLKKDDLTFCLVDSEVNLSAAYLLKKRVWRLDFGVGLGGSIGTNFNNDILKIRSNNAVAQTEEGPVFNEGDTETYEAKNSLFGRVYIPMTVGMWLGDKVEIFWEHRVGTGAEQVIDGELNKMGPSLAGLFGVRWHLDSFVPAN